MALVVGVARLMRVQVRFEHRHVFTSNETRSAKSGPHPRLASALHPGHGGTAAPCAVSPTLYDNDTNQNPC